MCILYVYCVHVLCVCAVVIPCIHVYYYTVCIYVYLERERERERDRRVKRDRCVLYALLCGCYVVCSFCGKPSHTAVPKSARIGTYTYDLCHMCPKICMYSCMHVCMHVCMHLYAVLCICMCICMHICKININTHIYIHTRVCVCVKHVIIICARTYNLYMSEWGKGKRSRWLLIIWESSCSIYWPFLCSPCMSRHLGIWGHVLKVELRAQVGKSFNILPGQSTPKVQRRSETSLTSAA